MGSRYEVEVTIISAKGLKNVNWRNGRLKPYAVAWVEPRNKSATRVDEEGDMHPYWDQKLMIPFTSPVDDSYLYMDIVHAGKADDGTKPLVGSTRLPFRNVDLGNCKGVVKKLDLVRMSGRPHGNVDVKVVVRETRYHAPDPYYAQPYGVPPHEMRYHAPDPYYAQPYGVPPQSYAGYSAVEPCKVGRSTTPGYGGYGQDGQQRQEANLGGVMFVEVEVTVGDDNSYDDGGYGYGGYADGGGYDDGY